MATEFSMLGIMNAALLAQGEEEIIAENDGSDQYRILARNWPQIVEAELEDGNYYFSKVQAQIVTRVDGKFGYDDGYLVPHDALHVRRVWFVDTSVVPNQRYSLDWVQDGEYVYVDRDDGIYMEYIEVGGLDLWSANFALGVQKRLEALLARSLKEEYSSASALEDDAEIHFQRARTNSSKARTAQPPYQKGPIARARNRRRGSS